MKKILLSTLLLTSLINVASATSQAPAELYKVEFHQWERSTLNNHAGGEFGQEDVTMKVQLNINLNEYAVSEDGKKVLAHSKDSEEALYLSSEYFNRHWVHDFLPWEPDLALYKSVLETGSEHAVILTDEGQLMVTMTNTSLNKMDQFVTESFHIIESPEVRTVSTDAQLPLPSNGEKSCSATIVSEKNRQIKTEFCVTRA